MTEPGAGLPDGGGQPPFRLPEGYEQASAVADAILYEGYLLYPYRKSAAKNQLRWQFGVLAPRAWAQRNLPPDEGVAGSAESWFQQAELLLTPSPGESAPAGCLPSLSLRLRFLHAQRRTVQAAAPGGGFTPVPQLEAGGRLLLSFDEAVPGQRDVAWPVCALLAARQEITMEIPGWQGCEEVRDAGGQLRGRVVRRRSPVTVTVSACADAVQAPLPLTRLRVRVENATAGVPADAPRPQALASALLAAHCFAALDGGRFVSLLDPPDWAASAARACCNVHTMPVLAGAPGSADMMLASPVILYDHPRIAPESPGDLFDAGEIDEILTLRTLTLTEAEKREARATDPRAAQIVDRAEATAPEVLARLHGTFRSRGGQDAPGDARPALQPGPGREVRAEEAMAVAGTGIGKGSRVRLRPRGHGTDAHDMFLAGRYALVEDVLTDIDGSRFLAVSIEDDPAAGLARELGRFFHFSPDEVEPAGPAAGPS